MIPYYVIDHFSIGPFKFYTWGFFIVLAFLVGMILAIRQAKKIGIGSDKIIWLIIFVYLGAIIGGRLFFVFQSPPEFFNNPSDIFNVSGGGMMFYGGLSGGAVAGWFYLRRIEKRLQLVNALIPIVFFAMAIGRIGCLLSNDHQGAITSVPWAILWPDGSLRHPVVLYLILFDLALAGVLWWWKYATKNHFFCHSRPVSQYRVNFSGNLDSDPCFRRDDAWIPAQGRNDKTSFFSSPIFLFLFLYPLGRFFLDFTRDSLADPHFWGLASSQWISLSLLTIALLHYIIKRTKYSGKFLKF